MDVRAAKTWISVSSDSVTFWLEIGSDSRRYVLKTVLWNIPPTSFDLGLDRGLKWGCEDPIGFLLLTYTDFKILYSSTNRNVLFECFHWLCQFFLPIGHCIYFFHNFASFLHKRIVNLSFSKASPAPTHAFVNVVEG